MTRHPHHPDQENQEQMNQMDQAVQEQGAEQGAEQAQTEQQATEQAAQTQQPAVVMKDGAKVLLNNGVPRLDYIRKRWTEGASRATIMKEVNSLKTPGSNDIPYQIVFSATKGRPGGPTPTPAQADTAQPASQAGEGQSQQAA